MRRKGKGDSQYFAKLVAGRERKQKQQTGTARVINAAKRASRRAARPRHQASPLQNCALVEYLLDEIGSQIGGGGTSSRLHSVQCGAWLL